MIKKSKYGGAELYFTFTPGDTKTIRVVTDIKGSSQFGPDEETMKIIEIEISSLSDTDRFVQIETFLGGFSIDRSDFSSFDADVTVFDIRVFFYNQFVSIEMNGFWVYSYAFSNIEYPTQLPSIQLKALNDDITVINIKRVELADGREAVFVDYEASTETAIQSIIQQRPVSIFPSIGRSVIFTYSATKDNVDAVFVSRFVDATNDSMQLASDALIYFTDVGISLNEDVLRDVGFVTRLYRLSELDTGAERAAETLQKRALEKRHSVTVIQRFDPRVEPMDILHINLVAKGTTRTIDRSIIVENTSISMRDGDSGMTIGGRYLL